MALSNSPQLQHVLAPAVDLAARGLPEHAVEEGVGHCVVPAEQISDGLAGLLASAAHCGPLRNKESVSGTAAGAQLCSHVKGRHREGLRVRSACRGTVSHARSVCFQGDAHFVHGMVKARM